MHGARARTRSRHLPVASGFSLAGIAPCGDSLPSPPLFEADEIQDDKQEGRGKFRTGEDWLRPDTKGRRGRRSAELGLGRGCVGRRQSAQFSYDKKPHIK